MVLLNFDNAESRQVVEDCYRTQKVLINPIIDWEDKDVWWYIRNYGIEVNPLYERGWTRVGCIGCPMAGKHRWEEFRQYPTYKNAYIKAFDRMIENGTKAGKKYGWRNGLECFHWWMEDKDYNPDQETLEQWLDEIGASSVLKLD